MRYPQVLIQAMIGVILASLAYANEDNGTDPTAYRTIDQLECRTVNNILSWHVGAPPTIYDQAFLYAQHLGDTGTPENINSVANPVSWDVSQFTGLSVPTPFQNYQRGFADVGPPIGTSALQLDCRRAGVFVNTFQFSHTSPILPGVSGGRGASYSESFSSPKSVWTFPVDSFLALDAKVRLPYQLWFPQEPGIGQISFFYYLQPLGMPLATGLNETPVFAHVIQIYDSRTPGDGNGSEFTGNDGLTFFISSPLREVGLDGRPVQWVSPSPFSPGRMRNTYSWSDLVHFQAEIKYSQALQAILAFAQANPTANIPLDPRQWGVITYGLIVETISADAPQCTSNSNQLGCSNIVMAVSIEDVNLREGSR